VTIAVYLDALDNRGLFLDSCMARSWGLSTRAPFLSLAGEICTPPRKLIRHQIHTHAASQLRRQTVDRQYPSVMQFRIVISIYPLLAPYRTPVHACCYYLLVVNHNQSNIYLVKTDVSHQCSGPISTSLTSTPSLNHLSASDIFTSLPLICLFHIRPSSPKVQSSRP
jgi:hypothetical protein